MNWRNEEQYPDWTAAEAMSRVMVRRAGGPDDLDDDGCRSLVEAVVRLAVEDYARALRALPFRSSAAALLKETAAFFRSEHFRRLTSLNGDALIRMIRKEVRKE